MQTNGRNLLVVRGLGFRDKGPIDFELSGTETLVVTGPSGSGKTMLLRAISDLDPHTGEVLLNGKSAGDMESPNWRRQVGMLPAENHWWFETVGAHLKAFDRDWLPAVGFEKDVLEWRIERLSTGEKKRLALVRLLSNYPKALLLDEPTANLDRVNTTRVEDLVAQYQRLYSAPVIWVSHEFDQQRRLGGRTFDVAAGKFDVESSR